MPGPVILILEPADDHGALLPHLGLHLGNLRAQMDHLRVFLGQGRHQLGDLAAQLREPLLVRAVVGAVNHARERFNRRGAAYLELRLLFHAVGFGADQLFLHLAQPGFGDRVILLAEHEAVAAGRVFKLLFGLLHLHAHVGHLARQPFARLGRFGPARRVVLLAKGAGERVAEAGREVGVPAVAADLDQAGQAERLDLDPCRRVVDQRRVGQRRASAEVQCALPG